MRIKTLIASVVVWVLVLPGCGGEGPFDNTAPKKPYRDKSRAELAREKAQPTKP